MTRIERIYEVHQLLGERRRGISRRELARRLGCSEPTVTRLVRVMRASLGAPIEHDRERGGYFYARDPGAPAWELPGVWMTADELRALFTLERLLAGLGPGLLSECLAPLSRRLEQLAVARKVSVAQAARRIRVLEPAVRPAGPHFRTVASAVIARRKVHIEYHGRSDDAISRRDVSPQRLVHYRGAWYVDAWCHLRDDLRSFAVDRITSAEWLEGRAREIDDAVLDRYFASAYGIFAGEPQAVAVLVFSPRAARWVAEESWHPRQQGRRLVDGSWELRVPYASPDELVGDILRWVPEVTVREPPELSELVCNRLRDGLVAMGRRTAAPRQNQPGDAPGPDSSVVDESRSDPPAR